MFLVVSQLRALMGARGVLRRVVIAGWLAVFAGWAVGAWRDQAPVRQAEPNRWRCRLYGVTAASILLAISLDRRHSAPRRREHGFLLLPFFFAGVVLYYWARLSIGRQWSSEARIVEGHRLVTGGAYRLVRHPIYLSKVLMALSSGMMLDKPLVLALGLALGAAGLYQARVEEALLRAHFPEAHAAYVTRTPLLLPLGWRFRREHLRHRRAA